MRYVLEPKDSLTGNAVLWQTMPNEIKNRTNNKPYLVIGIDDDSVLIKDDNGSINTYGDWHERRFIKQIDIKYAEPGDDIIFIRDINYSSNLKKDNPKKSDIFTITNIKKDGTINYGLYNATKTIEYGVQPKDVIILKTIKSDDEKQNVHENIQQVKIKKQTKEAIMPFQDIINQIFGVSAYDAKPKFLVTIYKPDGSEYANATADSIETIKEKAATDYRLIGHKIVAYKLHTEITTEITVTITRLKDEKSKEPEIGKQ